MNPILIKINRIFETNIACHDCPYHREWRESHPYGATYAYETLQDCQILDGLHQPFTDCPGLESGRDGGAK